MIRYFVKAAVVYYTTIDSLNITSIFKEVHNYYLMFIRYVSIIS